MISNLEMNISGGENDSMRLQSRSNHYRAQLLPQFPLNIRLIVLMQNAFTYFHISFISIECNFYVEILYQYTIVGYIRGMYMKL